MISSNKLALGLVAAVISALALVGQASAGQNNHHNHGVKVVIGTGNGHHNHNHHKHHNHFHQPQFRPLVIQPQVHVLYCVVVRQPNRYHDWDFHQVKCFHSEYEASLFASSLRSRFYDEHGFAVRVNRKVW